MSGGKISSAVWEEFAMLPYFSAIVEILKNPSVSGLFRFLSKVGDGMMKMRLSGLSFEAKILAIS